MGPLNGFKIIEFAGIGPGPLCGTFLGDMGADVIRIDRPNADPALSPGASGRSRRSIALDLKKPAAIDIALSLVESADALIEPYRPGVMERLGLGPDICLAKNPKLVYGRMTGWGQEGPLANSAGHDLNYIALTGVLNAIGRKDDVPVPPLNLVGDFGGGTMLLAFGLVCGLLETSRSGKGQVVDAAMIDGASMLMATIYGMHAMGGWTTQREDNLLDGAAHFYRCYECKDGKAVSIGSIEPQFYQLLREKLGLADDQSFDPQMDKSSWEALGDKLAVCFKEKTRDEWCDIMEGTDICFAPVLDLEEAPKHPHNVVRGGFVQVDNQMQPAPAPRFSRTQAKVEKGTPKIGGDTDDVLLECGFSKETLMQLRNDGAIV